MISARSNRSSSAWTLLAVLVVVPACETAEPEAQEAGEAAEALEAAERAAANEQVARQYLEAYNEQDLERMGELLADPFVLGGTEMGRDDFLGVVQGYWASFPDLRFLEPHVIPTDEWVAVRAEFEATGAGEFEGHDVDGQEVRVTETILFRMQDGRIHEYEYDWDELGFWVQLGVLEHPLGEEVE